MVFKAILGDPENLIVLLAFLNAVMAPVRITHAVIQNPSTLRKMLEEKEIVVDVRATDQDGRIYQIEMQCINHHALMARMLYGWARHYAGQLKEGSNYSALKPVISIWLVEDDLTSSPGWRHRVRASDELGKLETLPHFDLHIFELNKFLRERPRTLLPTTLEAWVHFFADAENWSEVPEALRNPAMEKAMAILEEIRTNSESNELYHQRMDNLRIERTREEGYRISEQERLAALARAEQERREKKEALEWEEQALAREEQALRQQQALQEELERLKAHLARMSSEV